MSARKPAAAGLNGPMGQGGLPFPTLISSHNSSPSTSTTHSRSSSHSGLPKHGLPSESKRRALGDSTRKNHGHGHNGQQSHKNAQEHNHEPITHVKPTSVGIDIQTSSNQFTTKASFSKWYRIASRDPDGNRLCILLAILGAYMCAQFLYGLVFRNAGLLAEALHTLFDCLSLSCSLFSIVYAGRPASSLYSYGYGRAEILAAFANAVFLIFVAVFNSFEALHHIYKPDEKHHSPIFFMLAWIGLAVDCVGIMFFRSRAIIRETGRTRISAHDMNVHSVFLHFLADSFANVGFIVATYVVHYQEMKAAHGISSIIVSILIVYTASPLFSRTATILLQTIGSNEKDAINKCMRDIETHDGVLECRGQHWWHHEPGFVVGTLHIRIKTNANEQSILCYVNGKMKPYVQDLTVQIEKDPAWMSA